MMPFRRVRLLDQLESLGPFEQVEDALAAESRKQRGLDEDFPEMAVRLTNERGD